MKYQGDSATGIVKVDGEPLSGTFEWGKPSLGAYRLSVALISQEFGNSGLLEHAERFTQSVVADLSGDWCLDSESVQAMIILFDILSERSHARDLAV